MKNKLIVLLASASIALVACGGGEQPVESAEPTATTAAEDVTQQITEEYIREVIIELSGDDYEGRGPATQGDLMTREYIIKQMQDIGLQPGAEDGGWEQPFQMVSVDTLPLEQEWTFEKDGSSVSFEYYEDFTMNGDNQTATPGVENAELVFAGYGIQAPEFGWDDYKNIDVTGKVVVLMNNDPDWDPELFAGETRLWYGRWDYKFLTAAKNGAAGAIIIHTIPSAGYPFQVLQTSNIGPQMELSVGDEARMQFKSFMTEDGVKELVALAGKDLDELRELAYNSDFEPVPLGITTSLTLDVAVNSVTTANVLGYLEGSDPVLKDEFVIYTAHHDHLGIGPPNEDGDTIYNGAMDNASGVGQILAMAKAFKALPEGHRRSVMFLFVGAEEQGLLGSKWYAANPTVSPGKIAANLNYDGGNLHGRTHDIVYIGFGKTSIDDLVIEYAAEQGRVVKPDQFADRGYFYRSDQFSFARIGVPAMYLDPGTDYVDRPPEWGRQVVEEYTSNHYHQPSDEYDPNWNLEGMIDDAKIGFWTGLAIANSDEMPTWNEGDEFEAARLKSLKALEEEQ
ncbi:MAG: M20/M25/M40 family metallo-hydrolase [Woeseiaceae bacterium]